MVRKDRLADPEKGIFPGGSRRIRGRSLSFAQEKNGNSAASAAGATTWALTPPGQNKVGGGADFEK